jgi:hypothetical protein
MDDDYIINTLKIYSKKVETMITNKEEESDKVGRSIQEMQGAIQKAAVEAAKAAAMQAA